MKLEYQYGRIMWIRSVKFLRTTDRTLINAYISSCCNTHSKTLVPKWFCTFICKRTYHNLIHRIYRPDHSRKIHYIFGIDSENVLTSCIEKDFLKNLKLKILIQIEIFKFLRECYDLSRIDAKIKNTLFLFSIN